MNSIASKINHLNITKALLLAATCSASILSIKTAYDLAGYSFAFPFWFVPVFSLGVTGLITISLILVLKALKVPPDTPLLTGRKSVYLWVLTSLSFICTTAVHRFYPFSPFCRQDSQDQFHNCYGRLDNIHHTGDRLHI